MHNCLAAGQVDVMVCYQTPLGFSLGMLDYLFQKCHGTYLFAGIAQGWQPGDINSASVLLHYLG